MQNGEQATRVERRVNVMQHDGNTKSIMYVEWKKYGEWAIRVEVS